ncbi:MAG: nucleotidyltransferase, partial [Anaerolineales bacterium]
MVDLSLIVMAAGIGSRYGGLKQIEPIGPHGETLLDYSLFDAISAGFGKIVFVISQNVADTFLSKVDQTIGQHCEVEFVIQELANIPHEMSLPPNRKKPWGTGHAVLSCKQSIHGPFAVINADDYYGRSSFSVLQDFLTRIVDP